MILGFVWHRAALENEPEGSARSIDIRKAYSRIPPQSDRQLREIIANTYGMIALIDHNVGRILKALEENGLAENTIVVYSTDHGDWLGDHGLILKGPMLYEGLLRIGCIFRGPGIPAGRCVDDPISTLDLAPTFLDYTGSAPLLDPHGVSLRDLIENRAGSSRDFARSEWELLPGRVGVALSLQTVRTGTDKLTLDLRSGAGELYDLRNDPHEMENRFDDPAYAARRRELEDMIRARPDDMRPVGTAIGMA